MIDSNILFVVVLRIIANERTIKFRSAAMSLHKITKCGNLNAMDQVSKPGPGHEQVDF